jgi:hypothetical protein
VELENVSEARLERQYGALRLRVDHRHGSGVVGLGFDEEAPVRALVAALARPAPALGAEPLREPAPAEDVDLTMAKPPERPADAACATEERVRFLWLLAARMHELQQLRERGERSGPFARLLERRLPKPLRASLFAAREALSRGNAADAHAVLAEASRSRHPVAFLALAELALASNRARDAIERLRTALDAGADERDVVGPLEHAARSEGDDPALARALEAKMRLAPDRASKKAVASELLGLRRRFARPEPREPRGEVAAATYRTAARPLPNEAPRPTPNARRPSERAKRATGNARPGREPSRTARTRGSAPERSKEPPMERTSLAPWVVLFGLLAAALVATLARALGSP